MTALALALFVLAQTAPAPSPEATSAPAGPVVAIETTLGEIRVALHPDKAPLTVDNFLGYVRSGFYTGTTFHRVMPDFMIQGGGYDATLEEKPTRPAVKNEARNGLRNLRGTIAMARTSEPHSATRRPPPRWQRPMPTNSMATPRRSIATSGDAAAAASWRWRRPRT